MVQPHRTGFRQLELLGGERVRAQAPVDGILGQPDVLDIVPFGSFTEYTNPSLLAYLILVGFDSTFAPTGPRICNRQPVGVPKAPKFEPFYNRLYSTINVRGLSCANHNPARPALGCKVDGDCSFPNGVCVSGSCDVAPGKVCNSNADCMPWESCPEPGCTSGCFASGCVPIGSCDNTDPFATSQCPATNDLGGPVPTFCNGGTCWRQ